MTIAMMLPTSLPRVILFRTITQRRANQSTLTAILLLGYLGVWTAFGRLAHFGDFWIHRIVESDSKLHANTWLLGVAPLIVAGAYQFTSLNTSASIRAARLTASWSNTGRVGTKSTRRCVSVWTTASFS